MRKRRLSPQGLRIKLQQMTAKEHADRLLALDESMKKRGLSVNDRAILINDWIIKLIAGGADAITVRTAYIISGLSDEHGTILEEIREEQEWDSE